MGDLVEILITSDSQGSQYTCSAWDPRTGINLMNYKGGNAANLNGLSHIKNEFIVTANSTKPLLHIWPINSQEQVPGLRFVMPGKVNALAISLDGNFLVSGIQESIYVWQICSGKMLCFIAKHYQTVNVIKFTDDGSHFVTAGQDGCVLVWNLTQIIGESETNYQPVYSFNDHALAVTDICLGHGGLRALMCSVSLDRTCKIYDLSTGNLLLNLVFGEPLSCVILDIIETNVYLGSNTGSIYAFSIKAAPRTKEYHITAEDYTNKFLGHNAKGVTCLALSFDGKILASGGENENVHLWDISSKQLLRTFPHKSSISNLKFSLSLSNMFSPEKQFHLIALNPKKMIEKHDKHHTVEIMMSDNFDNINNDNINLDLMTITGPQSNNIIQNYETTKDNSDELKKLRTEVIKLQKVNKELYSYFVDYILKKKN